MPITTPLLLKIRAWARAHGSADGDCYRARARAAVATPGPASVVRRCWRAGVQWQDPADFSRARARSCEFPLTGVEEQAAGVGQASHR